MSKTHWKKLNNPDFLGAYALEPGKDLVLTIASVKEESFTGMDGKKDRGIICRFVENVQPMIMNATNCKTISKIYKTPFIEDWTGKKIQLYTDTVRAFGDVVEALRIRDFIPQSNNPKCEECGCDIQSYGSFTAQQIAQRNSAKYGKALCVDCATKKKNELDVLNQLEELAKEGEENEQSETN